jgi:hypothetical protein
MLPSGHIGITAAFAAVECGLPPPAAAGRRPPAEPPPRKARAAHRKRPRRMMISSYGAACSARTNELLEVTSTCGVFEVFWNGNFRTNPVSCTVKNKLQWKWK